MTGVFIRIALRWLAGALIAHGWASADSIDMFIDPDIVAIIEVGLGVVAGAVAEFWYYIARRMGWET